MSADPLDPRGPEEIGKAPRQSPGDLLPERTGSPDSVRREIEKTRARMRDARRKKLLRRSAKRRAAQQEIRFNSHQRLRWQEFDVDATMVDRHARGLLEFLFGVESAPDLRTFEDWALAPDSFAKSASIAASSLRIPGPREPMGSTGIGDAESQSLAGASEQADAVAGSEHPESWSAWLDRSNLSVSFPARPDADAQSPSDKPDEEDRNERARIWKDIFNQ